MGDLRIACAPVGLLATNCYILSVDGREDCIVIDPGAKAESIRRAAQGKTVAAILLTHGHFDHIGAVDALAAEGTKVYIHKLDAPMLTEPKLNVSGMIGMHLTVSAPPCIVHEGDVISEAGISLTVLHTPGHTPGSVCYEAGTHLFTGDTLFDHGFGRTDLPGGSGAAMEESLRRLAPLQQTHTIYGGHG